MLQTKKKYTVNKTCANFFIQKKIHSRYRIHDQDHVTMILEHCPMQH